MTQASCMWCRSIVEREDVGEERLSFGDTRVAMSRVNLAARGDGIEGK